MNRNLLFYIVRILQCIVSEHRAIPKKTRKKDTIWSIQHLIISSTALQQTWRLICEDVWKHLLKQHRAKQQLTFPTLLDTDCWFSRLCSRLLTASYFLLFPERLSASSETGCPATPAVLPVFSSPLTGLTCCRPGASALDPPHARGAHQSASLPCYITPTMLLSLLVFE